MMPTIWLEIPTGKDNEASSGSVPGSVVDHHKLQHMLKIACYVIGCECRRQCWLQVEYECSRTGGLLIWSNKLKPLCKRRMPLCEQWHSIPLAFSQPSRTPT